jgi:hypothetical protein
MPNAASTPPIQVLKAGVHNDANGVRVQITDADLQAIADNYNPELHEAPFVVGHPSMDAPAYGWSAKFVVKDGVLFAEPAQVEEQFAELCREGRFKKVSLSLYGPNARGNPCPGTWYPRHVGFLGAMPPAIKGLKSVQFAEGEDGIHEFSDSYATSTVVRLLRGMRDWMLTQFGQETADRVLPAYELDYANNTLVADQAVEQANTSTEGLSPAFGEGQSTGAGDDAMSTQASELQAQLDAANQRAADAEAALQSRRQADEAAAHESRQADAVSFAERMVSEARIPAERKDHLVGLLMQAGAVADASGAVLSFGEGDAAITGVQALKDLVQMLPQKVEFGEVATRHNRDASDLDDVDGQVQFGEGAQLDATRLTLHHKVLARQREAKAAGQALSYAEALTAVNR